MELGSVKATSEFTGRLKRKENILFPSHFWHKGEEETHNLSHPLPSYATVAFFHLKG